MARSYSVAWPIDSWMTSHRLVGSMTRSVGPRLDARRPDLLGEQLGQLGELGVPVPAGAGEVLPAAAGRRRERAQRLEAAAGPVDGGDRDVGVDAHPLLGGRGAGRVGVEALLLDLHEARGDVVDAGRGEQRPRPVGEQGDLVGDVDGPGVDVVGRDPDRVGVHRLVGERDPLGGQRGEGRGDVERPRAPWPPRPRGSGRRGRRSPTRRRAARARPARAVSESEATTTRPSRSSRCWVRRRCTRRSACSGPAPARGVERGVGEGRERQGEEVRVHRVRPAAGHGRRTYRPPATGLRINRRGPTVR